MAAPRPAFGWEPPSSADGPHVGRSLAMVFGKQGVFFGLVTSFANGAYQVFYPADGGQKCPACKRHLCWAER